VSIKRGRPKNEGNSDQKKSQILSAASQAFAQYGFDKTDVNVISNEIGVCKGTIYYYFQNKEKLFLSCVDKLMQQLIESINKLEDQNKDQLLVIEDAIYSYFTFFDEHPEFVELLIQERAIFKSREKPTYFKYREQNAIRWKERYKELIKAGRIRQISVDQIVDVIGDTVYGVVFINYFSGRSKSMEQQAKDVIDIFFNGILSDSEIQHRKNERL
jgi:AcrR family transcriptional regulator